MWISVLTKKIVFLFLFFFFAAIMADYFLSLNVASSKQLVDKARGVFHR